jgi:cytochrome c oxidase cbb3-type subunit III
MQLMPLPRLVPLRLIGRGCSRAVCLLGVLVSLLVGGGASAQAPAEAARVEAGRALYARYCQLCHAPDGTGYAADEAPSLVSPSFLATANDAFIARGIRFGRPNTAMAAYGKARGGPLDDGQIASIVRFLRSKGRGAVRLPEVKVKGNAALGAQVYERECRSCHGTAQQPGKAPQLFNTEFLAAATPAFLRHAILHGRPPTRMPAFEKRLSASQVDDVLAWLTSQRAGAPPAGPGNTNVPRDLPLIINPHGKAPDFSLRDGRFVSATQVAQALEKKRRLIIIDARAPSDWLLFHIPGAVPLPYYDKAELDRIPNDGTWVVAYCACPHHASGEVVDALRRRGYPNTAVLDEGILYWRKTGYPIEGQAPPPP